MEPKQPARLQVDPESITDDDKPPQTGHTFNIWYLKWAGGDSSSRNYIKLKFKVNIKQDSGYTKGTEHVSPICLFFARGCCYRGKNCPYLHRLPSIQDRRIPTQDCFGRDKTTDYRDDMGGVGLLQRSNRTLYIGGLHMNDTIDEVISRHFLEFGSIEKVRVLYGKSCAFLTYKLEVEAQFAKEAMDAQSIDGEDVLSVKWANEDPNPNADDLGKRQLEESAMETVKKLLGNEKRRKKEEPLELPLQEPKTEQDVSPLPPEDEGSGFFDSARIKLLKQSRKRAPVIEKPQQSMQLLANYSSDDE